MHQAFLGQGCFSAIWKENIHFRMSYGPQGTLGLDYIFSDSLRYDLRACGAQVIAGCGCVGFPVLLCCPGGYALGDGGLSMPLNLQMKGMCVDSRFFFRAWPLWPA